VGSEMCIRDRFDLMSFFTTEFDNVEEFYEVSIFF
jgi:hypothetical protein